MYPGIEILACNTTVALVDGGDYPIVLCTEPDPEVRAEMEGNAEFIVRACNCHDDLVAALEAVVEIMNEETTKFAASRIVKAGMAVSMAAAAIRKAKGEKPC